MALFKNCVFLYVRHAILCYSKSSTSNILESVCLKKKKISETAYEICEQKCLDTFSLANPSYKLYNDLRENLLKTSNITSFHIDNAVLDLCFNYRHVNAGIYYFKYLKSYNYETTMVTITKYLKLYEIKQPLTKNDETEIIDTYKVIVEQFPILDALSANICISVLCRIHEWKECIEIIERYESCDSGFLAIGYNMLINYFFEHEDEKRGYIYLDKAYRKNSFITYNYFYDTYLKYHSKKGTLNEGVVKLFDLWLKYDVKPPISLIENLIYVCKEAGWSANVTYIQDGRCNQCGQNLHISTLTDEEFKHLSKVIMQKLILEKGYLVTSPTEFQNFMNFIKYRKPYDIVIDGLNLLIGANESNTVNVVMLNAFKDLYLKNRKVLIIGRTHIKRHKYFKHLLSKTTDIFCLKNVSEDDPFTLYAAVASGKNTIIVSKDFMRQHEFALQSAELRVLFKRWLLSNQYICDRNGTLKNLSSESNIHYGVHKKEGHWHIPYSLSLARQNDAAPRNWSCFKMNST